MGRWIRPRQLISVGVTIQEQIEWAEMGLNVYDLEGRRIVERQPAKVLPYGCKHLTSTDSYRFGDTFQYCSWRDTHKFFEQFQFNTAELVTFISSKKRRSRHLFHDRIDYAMQNNQSPDEVFSKIEEEVAKLPTILSEIYSPELARLLDIQHNVPETKKQTHHIPDNSNTSPINTDKYDVDNQYKDTSNAIESRRISTAKAWSQDLAIAIGLAVECAEAKKQKSTAQHRIMWEKRCAEKGIDSPRKEAFAAFRRGLPAHLKMEKN